VTESTPLRIWMTNCLSMNGGDAAIVEATMASLRDAFAPRRIEFTIVDANPGVGAQLFPSLRLRPWPWHVFAARGVHRLPRFLQSAVRARAYAAAYLIGRGAPTLARPLLRNAEWRFLREYSRADLVLSKGGTYLVEHYDLEPHIFDFRLCLLLRRPLVLGPQSLGPFADPRNRRLLRKIFARSTIFARDQRSLRNIESLGVRTRDAEVTADAAFVLARPETLRRARTRQLARSPEIAISVREWRHFTSGDDRTGMDRYVRAVEALATHLTRRHSARVTFVSTCQGIPEYWTDDSRLARTILERLPDDAASRTTVDGARYSPAALLERLERVDGAVATRMHFAVLALSAGVPVLPIAYEFKTNELFERLGLAAWVQDIENIDPESLVDAMDRFLAALPELRPGLFERVERERELALVTARRIADLVNGVPRARKAP
jgi:colanic acid/amylovoran biosynthesis protein